MLGKTFKGLTDAVLTWQTEQFLARESRRTKTTVYIDPPLVVEIAIDGVQASTRYPGGIALRFARVLGYRPDKSVDEVDTLDTVIALGAGDDDTPTPTPTPSPMSTPIPRHSVSAIATIRSHGFAVGHARPESAGGLETCRRRQARPSPTRPLLPRFRGTNGARGVTAVPTDRCRARRARRGVRGRLPAPLVSVLQARSAPPWGRKM